MADTAEKLSAKQERALVALLATAEVRAAAQESGAGETSIWRWLQEPGFAAEYRRRRSQMVEGAVAAMQRACVKAVETLVSVMDDAQAPASARVAAARAVIEQSMKAIEQEEIITRLERLEQLAGERGVMALDGRVSKLETAFGVAGGDGPCECGGADVRRYAAGTREEAARDERPAEVCSRCGRPRLIVNIVRVPAKATEEGWKDVARN